MIIDGNAIARDIYAELTERIRENGYRPHLTVFTCAPNFETQKFLALKRKRAGEVGIAHFLLRYVSMKSSHESPARSMLMR